MFRETLLVRCVQYIPNKWTAACRYRHLFYKSDSFMIAVAQALHWLSVDKQQKQPNERFFVFIFRPFVWACCCVGLMLSLLAVRSTSAQEAAAESPEIKIVLRISKDFICSHGPPPIERVASIDRCLFGARVTGTATTKGQAALTVDGDQSKPSFTFHFKGTTTQRTVASQHPVKAYSTGVTTFDVYRPIFFEGLEFSDGPEVIEASQSSRLDRLSVPPGLRGSIVRLFATPRIEEKRPQGDAIALRETKATLLADFGKETDRLVAELNSRMPWKQTLAMLMPQQTEWVEHFASTKDWILVSPGPKGATIPELPEESVELQAPMELWVYGKPDGPAATKVVALWNTIHNGLDRFRVLPPAASTVVKGIEPSAVGNWWVIRAGADLLEGMIDKAKAD